eukprot:SAG31_NODE_13969_length_834_cov_0.926531_3_plen_50_part_01
MIFYLGHKPENYGLRLQNYGKRSHQVLLFCPFLPVKSTSNPMPGNNVMRD